jgi:hypothetical protein
MRSALHELRLAFPAYQNMNKIVQELEDLAAVLYNSSSTPEQRQLALQHFERLFQ